VGLAHKHYIVRAEVLRPFTKQKVVKKWLKKLVKSIGMKICKHGGPHVDYVDKPGNYGIAGIVMIETSHISIHIWDRQESPLVQLDVYSCAPFDCKEVDRLLEVMVPTKMRSWLIDRADDLRLVEDVDIRDVSKLSDHLRAISIHLQ
jgi:S-adenosylmethionine/arginine decarboxylase-like enzyme